MLGMITMRRRLQANAQERERALLSGTSDHESERVGSSRRKRRKRECQHDPLAQELAKIIARTYHWVAKPITVKEEYGNGLGKFLTDHFF